MATLDNLPGVQTVIEQVGLLERAFYDPIEAMEAYGRLADNEIFPTGIGETLTKSRPALYPLAAALTPLVPSSNTNTLDNGLTDTFYTFEQFQISIAEYALTTSVNIMQDPTLIVKLFLQNYKQLGESAGRTLDGLAAQYIHTAYDSGNTFSTTTVSSGNTITVDNINGFDTVFQTSNSPGLPVATGTGGVNASISVYDQTTFALKGTFLISAATPNANTSTGNASSVFGRSGTLTTTTTIAITINAGDQILASDGSYVLRPNSKNSRFKLAATDLLTLQLIAQATAKLRARNVPPLPNGNYLAIIDPTIWPQLMSDQAWQYASMGTIGEGFFKNSIVNRTLGVEFINSNLVPRFYTATNTTNNAANVFARHCVVGGMGLLIKGHFQGALDAAQFAQRGGNADIRLIEGAKVRLITRSPVDRLQEWVTQTFSWAGGLVAPTDVTSTPLIIPTTDNARYKRAVVIEVASSI